MLSLATYVCATYGNLKTPRRMPGGLSGHFFTRAVGHHRIWMG
jgi:hypothetical protein